MKYFLLMWGAYLTGAKTLRIKKSSAALANIDLTETPTTIPDWMPTGDGNVNYDLLKNLQDTLNAADPNNYTVTWQTDSITGMTGHIIIAGTADFELHWSNAATTLDAAWFGFYGDADSAGSNSYTSPAQSSLIWAPQVPASDHAPRPMPRATVHVTETLDPGRVVVDRLAVEQCDWSPRTFTVMKSTSWTLRGAASLRIDQVRERYILRSGEQTEVHDALEEWWDHASQGKWFAVFDDNASPGVNASTQGCWARIHDEAVLQDLANAVRRLRQPLTPILYSVDIPYRVHSIGDLGANGGGA